MNQTQLINNLFEGVSSVARNVNALITDKASQSEMVVLHLIMSEEKETGKARIQLSKISRELCISRPAVTQCVDRMVSRELLVRCSDPEDRRAVYVELTEKGRECCEAAKRRAVQIAGRIVSHIGEENAKQLVYLMGELKEAIETEAKLMRS